MTVKINTKNATYPIKSNYIEYNIQIIKILKEPPPFDYDNFYDKNANMYIDKIINAALEDE